MTNKRCARRRTVLDILARLIRSDDQGKYGREDAIHSLLIPMRTDSNEISTDVSNLWIIDERLAFHDYLASDKTLKSMPISGSNSTKEPDVLATRFVNAPLLAAEGKTLPLPSIVVVEIKRPMRNNASEAKDLIQQCLDYVKRVRAGGVKTRIRSADTGDAGASGVLLHRRGSPADDGGQGASMRVCVLPTTDSATSASTSRTRHTSK